jgi:hypothetical protein
MASTSMHGSAPEQSHDDEHYVWMHAFTGDARKMLLDEDLAAGRNVGRVLFTVLGAGLVLAIIAVIVATI